MVSAVSLIMILLLYSGNFGIKYREVTLLLNGDNFNLKTTERG